MNNEKITPRDVDFAKWYTDIIRVADLVDYSSMKGSMIIRPYGYAIWESMVAELDREFKRLGHQNVQMPMFFPESLLQIEKDHVEGFAPEVAWVTHGGLNELEERVCVRPTSETLFCEHFKKIIKSYRDLPLLYNQWCTIVRWERTTRPFLRSREILWQEGHTMHATKEEAIKETMQMLELYEKFQKDFLALPVLVGKKTDKEKFAGAEETYTIEAMMYDGVALQNGTSHYFGQNFAKAFDIKFLDKNNELVTPYQTSWGCTTRMIGGLIMTHSDDLGLVLPPKIAPIKVALIPIKDTEEITLAVQELKSELEKEGITYIVDESDKSPGFKFANAEVKGYPIRIEIGPRDLQNNHITLVRRDTLEKITINKEDGIAKVKELLTTIQKNLYDRAKNRRDSMIYKLNTYEELKEMAKKQGGFAYVNWCGNISCEDKIKADLGLKSRCIPLKNESVDNVCICCGQKAVTKIYFGKQY